MEENLKRAIELLHAAADVIADMEDRDQNNPTRMEIQAFLDNIGSER